jgi:hypothetical protein
VRQSMIAARWAAWVSGRFSKSRSGETGRERAQVRVLEHVCVGVFGVQRAQLRCGGRDRGDVDGIGGEPPLEAVHPPSGLSG